MSNAVISTKTMPEFGAKKAIFARIWGKFLFTSGGFTDDTKKDFNR